MKKNKTLIIIVLAILIIFLIYRKMKSAKEEIPVQQDTQPSPRVSTPPPSPRDYFNGDALIKRGDRGKNVEMAQGAINRVRSLKGGTKLVVDGIFGSKTEAGVMEVMGAKTTTYNQLKQKVISIYTTAGKPNPYISQTPSEPTEEEAVSSYLSNFLGGIDGNAFTFF